MIERNRSYCKYVEIFTHRVGSIGAPSRRTNTKQWKVPNVASIFQKGSARFKATIHVKEVDQGGVSVYVKNADLISLRHQYKYTEHEEKTTHKNRWTQTSAGLASVEVIGFQTIEAYSNLDLTKVHTNTKGIIIIIILSYM
jgi:hypothetical protein